MKLQFRRHGKQFFFYTACLQGRPQVLSRLEEGAKWPILLPPGEAVKTSLLAVHAANPALTMSDFVIMPDHGARSSGLPHHARQLRAHERPRSLPLRRRGRPHLHLYALGVSRGVGSRAPGRLG